MNFLAATARVCPWAWVVIEPPRFRLNRSLLSLICSLHKSPCLEPAPTDRSLNRAPTARVRTADVVESQKIEPAEQAAAKTEKKKLSKKNLLKQLHVGSAQRNWFKLTAGITGILPTSGGPLPFIPLLA